MRLRLALLIVCFAVVAAPLVAQNVSATINGTVRDSTGAVVPGASVTLTNDLTGATRSTKTNNEGYFVFPDLLAGTYSVAVEMTGFRPYRQSGIRLNSGDIRALGELTLTVGELAEVVTVEATAAPVELGSGEKSGVVTGEEIDSLAIRGRDFLDVMRLLPGVVDEKEDREAPGPDGIRSIFINGARENQKNMTVDGVTNMDTGSNSTTHTAPTIDMIAEVKVLTSNYQAEFGRAIGGTIIVVTRGGTQQYRGTASWSHRHESFNANNYFNNQRNTPRPPYRYNIGGWSMGGPVWPKNRKQSKLFFFFSQEIIRQRVNYDARTVRVPNLLEREGDFTQTFDVNNRLIAVYDPLTNTPFPGNIIPKDRHHRTGVAILNNLFPKPNFVDPEPSRVNQWNYISQVSGSYPRRQEMIRIDFNPTQRLQTYVRYTQDADEQHPTYGVWINGNLNYDLTPVTFKQPGRGLTINVTRGIGASWMNQLILGYSMNRLSSAPDYPERIIKKNLGIDLPQWRPEFNPAGYIPNISAFGNVPNAVNPSLHNAMPYRNVNHIFSIVENLTKVHGRHTLRGGVYIERTRKDQKQGTLTRGQISFADDSNNPLRTRYGFASALMGIMTSYQEATNQPYGLYRFTNFEWYIQDNWRVNRRLAIDIGVRFYRNRPQAEIRGQTSAFVPGLWDPAKAPILIANGRDSRGNRVGINPLTGDIFNPGFVGTFAPGFGDPANGMVTGGAKGFPKSLYVGPGLALGPRFGFAYDPIGKGQTALRGGAGIFYDRVMGNPTMNMIANPPTVFSPTVYYTTFNELAASANSALLAPSTIDHSLFGKGFLPTVYNYSFGVQQAIGRRGKIDVSYVGNIARHLLWRRNINPEPAGSRFLVRNPQNRDPVTNAVYSPNFLRAYRGYGDIRMYEWGGTSNYNSLQSAFMTRMRSGLQVRASYTFAKTLGSAASDTSEVSAFLPPRVRNYGKLSYDRDHVFTMNFTWGVPRQWLPQNKWLRAPIERWELNGTTQMSRGQPFTPSLATVDGMNFTGTGTEGARPDWLGGNEFARPALPRVSGVPEEIYWGNAGVGILRRPGINNWDLRVTRRFRLFSERRSLEFRSEFFNLFNHTQFSGLDTTARFDNTGSQINSLFLQPTSARRPRHIQFAMKLYF